MNPSRAIAQAARLIKKEGESVQWNSIAVAPGTQQWKSTSTSTPYTVFIKFLRPYGGLSNALKHLLKGTEVVAGGPRALLAGGQEFEPNLTDTVIRNGQTLFVDKVNPVDVNGINVVYEIQFK